jgi:aryl-alcohol dehydrogenase-like predicted oxidoreductase
MSTHFKEPEVSRNIELAEKLGPIAVKNGRTVTQLAIAWVLRRPELTSAIVGARKPSQVGETALAGDWKPEYSRPGTQNSSFKAASGTTANG